MAHCYCEETRGRREERRREGNLILRGCFFIGVNEVGTRSFCFLDFCYFCRSSDGCCCRVVIFMEIVTSVC
ncbi:hypothetical protein L2E82_30409 [Cichorium intybus]|uniref:Uncharacterized protein n=1 Tax=Cichorium intybus TaxID=13427 RepID=A0ACB9D0A8_CICIN|nr:hypothetical protein L2E82_30409 [Cichorium intybus]